MPAPPGHRADVRWCEPIAGGLAIAALTGACAIAQDAGPPPTLRETGLYADWQTGAVASDNLPFAPQYPLWSDGAGKRRWIHLPAGTAIDSSDPDGWIFPVGTRFWKEFSIGGRRVETRTMERTEAGWIFAAYVWSPDGDEAALAPAAGLVTEVEVAPGERHAIPSRTDCRVCHDNGPTPVLGFSALQLSPDRDPYAPHREPVPSGAIDLAGLVAHGLVRGATRPLVDPPPRIAARSPTERAALGYLHANCGGCHRSSGPLASLELSLARSVVEREPAPAIGLGDARPSTLLARMSSADPFTRMPPLGTRRVDADAVRLVATWIEGMPSSPANEGEE